ncbi:unnamed protein product [Caenorhabditis auriculariae]|uniref:Uncharacterized protein n=1 Tax=Caenorhabditis auriculariae TaxID=2777116 RepID=A0A8S1HEK8_9PELO|nr:unnamed protein product [Caenorhabditis auriculariae]
MFFKPSPIFLILVLLALSLALYTVLPIISIQRQRMSLETDNRNSLFREGNGMFYEVKNKPEVNEDDKKMWYPYCSPGEIRDSERLLTTEMGAFRGNGSLGEQLFELASLYGLSRSLNRKPVLDLTIPNLPVTLQSAVNRLFPRLISYFQLRFTDTFPTREEVDVRRNESLLFESLETSPAQAALGFYLHVNTSSFKSYKYFDKYRELLGVMRVTDTQLQEQANAILPETQKEDFLICMHVDNSTGESSAEEKKLSRFAAEYLVKKHFGKMTQNISVAVIGRGSNDWRKVFEEFTITTESLSHLYDLIYTDSNEIVDLVFSQKHCHVVLLADSLSVPGWWFAYLSKAKDQIFYREPKESNEITNLDDYFPQTWIKLRLTVHSRQ